MAVVTRFKARYTFGRSETEAVVFIPIRDTEEWICPSVFCGVSYRTSKTSMVQAVNYLLEQDNTTQHNTTQHNALDVHSKTRLTIRLPVESSFTTTFYAFFAALRKVPISFVLSVRPRRTTWLPLDGFSWNLIFEDFKKLSRKFKFD
jgi:hypothetical protein